MLCSPFFYSYFCKVDISNKDKQNSQEERSGKTAAALGYIPIIGLLAAILLHGNNKTKLSAFHLRQAVGMHVTMLIVYFVGNILYFVGKFFNFIPILGSAIEIVVWLVLNILWLAIIVMLFIGFVHAINKNKKLLPIVGETFQSVFAGID